MNPDTTPQPETEATTQSTFTTVTAPLHQPTSISKILAAVLFIILPFIGGVIGYSLAPVQIVKVAVAPAAVTEPVASTDTQPYLSTATTSLPNLQVVVLTEFDSAEAQNPQQSEIVLTTVTGPESLGVFEGNCVVAADSLNVLNDRVELQTLITEPAQIVSRVYCGLNDAGSEVVLYKKTESPLVYEIVQLKLGGSEGQILAEDVTNVLTVLKTLSE